MKLLEFQKRTIVVFTADRRDRTSVHVEILIADNFAKMISSVALV